MANRDPEATKARILAAALREFSAKGISGARVDAIAARAKVNKRMLYYYFESKEGLFREILRRRLHERSANLRTTGASEIVAPGIPRPLFGSRASFSNTWSISASSRNGAATGASASEGASDSSKRYQCGEAALRTLVTPGSELRAFGANTGDGIQVVLAGFAGARFCGGG